MTIVFLYKFLETIDYMSKLHILQNELKIKFNPKASGGFLNYPF